MSRPKKITVPDSPFLTVNEFAKVSNIGQKALRKIISAFDDFPAVRVGAKQMILRTNAFAWLEENYLKVNEELKKG